MDQILSTVSFDWAPFTGDMPRGDDKWSGSVRLGIWLAGMAGSWLLAIRLVEMVA